jgi:hypothetical protein
LAHQDVPFNIPSQIPPLPNQGLHPPRPHTPTLSLRIQLPSLPITSKPFS